MISSNALQQYSSNGYFGNNYQSDLQNQLNNRAHQSYAKIEQNNEVNGANGTLSSSDSSSSNSSSSNSNNKSLMNNGYNGNDNKVDNWVGQQKPISNNSELSSAENGCGDKYVCEICGDESDGLHFGQYSCRACAAFFRRTISLKLEYTCKRENKCHIEKSARNMCRSCRFQKCLDKGMQAAAVQHMRDGLGKRNTAKKSSELSSGMPDTKILKSINSDARVCNSDDEHVTFSSSANPHKLSQMNANNIQFYSTPTDNSSTTNARQLNVLYHSQQQNQSQQQNPIIANNFASAPATASVAFSGNEFFLVDAGALPILQLGANMPITTNMEGANTNELNYDTSKAHNNDRLTQSYVDFGTSPNSAFTAIQQNNLNSSLHNLSSSVSNSAIAAATSKSLSSSSSRSSDQQQPELKYLSHMLEGYYHFASLRKASYALVQGPMKFCEANEIPQSNFGTCKKLCRIEASLIMDTVEKFFEPFKSLSSADKNLLFDSFYCLFSNTERAYRTYKTFGPDDDRLLMPDGGYVRLSELKKFYENNAIVVGDPNQVAEIFKNTMEYVVKVVVTHMRRIELTEIELMALFGLFVWKDTENLSAEGQQIVERSRDNILVDLHAFYRSLGYLESEITVKSANFLLLMPKLETFLKRLKDNFDIAELFNFMEAGSCCPKK